MECENLLKGVVLSLVFELRIFILLVYPLNNGFLVSKKNNGFLSSILSAFAVLVALMVTCPLCSPMFNVFI